MKTDWIQLLHSGSLALEGIKFSFMPDESNVGQVVEIEYNIKDDNTQAPKNSTHLLTVKVVSSKLNQSECIANSLKSTQDNDTQSVES